MIMKTILFVLLSSLSIVAASRVEARAPTSFKRFVPIPPPPPAPSKRFIPIPPPPPPPAPSKRFIPTPPPPPAPSKRFVPILPPPPAPSKRVDSFVSLNKRSLVEHAPPSGPSPWFVPRDNSKREPAPLVDTQALDLSKRSADAAVPQKRGIDEQHVVQADSQRGFCFDGLMACPVLSSPGQFPRTFAEWEAIGFECVDFTADLSSCGGCSSLDPMRHDCTMIPHVQSVACVAGECQVSSCQAGYLPDSDGLGCLEMD